MRLTVEDDATGVRSDVHVDCEPSDQVGDVLAMIGAVLPVHGPPAVDGGPLRLVSGAAAGTELPLVPGQTVIVGRAAACQLVLDDPDVSRRHAQFVVGPSRVTLADLGSRN